MHKISVITPVHNSFALMKRNLENLEKMPENAVELVVVDDCSTDESYAQAVMYSKNCHFNMIVLKNEKNSGPGASRNLGIDAATGDYITFVDSDDYLTDDFYERVQPFMDQEIDCAIFDYQSVSEMGDPLASGRSIGVAGISEGFLDPRIAFVYAFGSTCGKLYKKSIIDCNHIRFGAFFRNEDMPFTKLALAKSERIFYLQQDIYNYVQVSTSLMHNAVLNDETNCQKAFQMLSESLLDTDLKEELLAIELREVLNNSVLIKIGNGRPSNEIVSYIKENYRMEHIRNKYFSRYPIYVKVTSWMAYLRCVAVLRLIWRVKRWKKSKS